MFKLFTFFALLAAAFAAPAPGPSPGVAILPTYDAYAVPAALPVATSSQAIIQNHNSLKLGYAYPSYPAYQTYLAL